LFKLFIKKWAIFDFPFDEPPYSFLCLTSGSEDGKDFPKELNRDLPQEGHRKKKEFL
jgi:hypothetical protein